MTDHSAKAAAVATVVTLVTFVLVHQLIRRKPGSQRRAKPVLPPSGPARFYSLPPSGPAVTNEDAMPARMKASLQKREAPPAAAAEEMPTRMKAALLRKQQEEAPAAAGEEMPARMKAALGRKTQEASPSSTGEEMPARMKAALARKPQEKGEPAVVANHKGWVAPPPLGAILQLAKETGKSRAECKKALIGHDNNYDAAKGSLMPEAAPSECGCESSGAIDGVFEPCEDFAGGRPGWMFKRGHLGTGYYRDAPMATPPAKG